MGRKSNRSRTKASNALNAPLSRAAKLKRAAEVYEAAVEHMDALKAMAADF